MKDSIKFALSVLILVSIFTTFSLQKNGKNNFNFWKDDHLKFTNPPNSPAQERMRMRHSGNICLRGGVDELCSEIETEGDPVLRIYSSDLEESNDWIEIYRDGEERK